MGILPFIAVLAWAASSTFTTPGGGSCAASISLSGGNLTATSSVTNTFSGCLTSPVSYTVGQSTQRYVEYKLTAGAASNGSNELMGLYSDLAGTHAIQQQPRLSEVYTSDGQATMPRSSQTFCGGLNVGNYIGFAVDFSTKLWWCTTSAGNWNNLAGDKPDVGSQSGGYPFSAIPGGTALFPGAVLYQFNGVTEAVQVNTTGSFHYTVPTGYSAWDSGSGGACYRPMLGVGC